MSWINLQPGMHADIPEDRYHADDLLPAPTLSSSLARVILDRSPLHAWYAHPRLNPDFEPAPASAALDLGACAHAMLLGRGQPIVIIDAENFRTKAAQQARDQARAEGKIPMLPHDHDRALEMAAAVREQLAKIPGCERTLVDGAPEQTLVWGEAGDVWCRARLDWMEMSPGLIVTDLKSTGQSANPFGLGRKIADMGYDVQAAFYRRGLKALGLEDGRRPATFRFAFFEDEPPYALSVCELDAMSMDWAHRKVERAIAAWRMSMQSGRWSGYPPMIARLELPAWSLAQAAEAEISAEQTSERLLEFSRRAQEPLETTR